MTRMAARLLICFAIGGATIRSFASGAAACAGPQFRGGGAHDAVYCSDPVRTLGGLRWRFATDGPVRSSPVVSGGVVFVGSGDRRLYAIDARTGREIWRFVAGAPVDATPAAAGGRVFAATRERAFAVEAATGREIWSRPFGDDLPLPGGFGYGFETHLSSPCVEGDAVFVGGGDGVLYRIDAATGKPVWRFATRGRIRATPAAAGGLVCVGSFDGVFYAVDAKTGGLRWKYETEGASLDLAKAGFDRRAIDSSAAISGGIVTFGSRDAHQYALDAVTGALRWRFGHPAAIVPDHAEVAWCEGSPAIAGGTTYVGSSDGHFVNAVDLATGKERWRHATPSRVNSSPAVVGDTLVVGGEEGSIFALSRDDGRLLWSYAVDEAVRSSPAVADGTVYVGADDGAVYALAGPAAGAAFLPWKAVYFDEKLSGWFSGGKLLAEYLRGCGFQIVDAVALPAFLAARAEDRAASVVVFASDEPPAAVVAADGAPPLIERYLRAGGQAVWVGFHPFALVFDESTGARKGLDFVRSRRLIGVGPDAPGIELIEEEAASPTEEGRAWGLPATSIASSPVDPRDVTTVLARDPFGRANAWVKSFGEGRLVRIWGRRDPIRDLETVRRVAEHAVETHCSGAYGGGATRRETGRRPSTFGRDNAGVPVFRLDDRLVFPSPSLAEEGLLAVGGDLRPERLLLAYSSGIFPWYDEGQPILWHSPDPRMVLEAAKLHVPKSLEKRIRKAPYRLTMDTAFRAVMEGCAAAPRPEGPGTWITPEMIEAYVELHRRGFAHSTEAWEGEALAGGLYGVSLGSAYFGESMFARSPDASKIAFVALVRQLDRWGIGLIDCQVYTEHLDRFGAEEWPRERYLRALRAALARPTRRGKWELERGAA